MEKSNNRTSRRKIVKSLGAVGSASALGGLALSNATAQPNDATSESEVEVVDATLQTDRPVSTSSGDSSVSQKTRELIEFIERNSKLSGDTTTNLAIDVQTNSEEFNDHDPVIDIIPFGSEEGASADRGRGPQRGAGLLYVYSVIEDGERVPIGTFGLTSRPLGGRGKGNDSEPDRYQVTSYVLDEGEPVKANRQVRKASEIGAAGGGVSAQASVVCYSCQALVDSVCVGGTRVLGQYACVGACSVAFGANFIAIFGCASICSTMFTAISAVGCTAGGSIICKEMSDIAPWGINFC